MTPKQQDTLDVYRNFWLTQRRSPTLAEVGDARGVLRHSVFKQKRALVEKGHLDEDEHGNIRIDFNYLLDQFHQKNFIQIMDASDANGLWK